MKTVALAALVALRAPTAPTGEAPVCPEWSAQAEARVARLEARLVELVNEARHAAGAPPVAVETRLVAVARAHAARMARLRTMAHVTDGESAEDRLRAAGIRDWDAVGENLAMGRSVDYVAEIAKGRHRRVACHAPETLARDVFRAWYASPGHRQTLLDPRFTHLGSGAAYEPVGETAYVAHDFARLVTCGYEGAPCCPAPAGIVGGICQRPTHCHAGTCVPETAPVAQ